MMRGIIRAAILAGMLLLGGTQALMAEEAAAAAPAATPGVTPAPSDTPAAAPAPSDTPAIAPAPSDTPAAGPAKGDDLAALIAAAALPERLKDHVPNFSAKEEEFEFQIVSAGEKPAAGDAEKTLGLGIFDKPAEKGKPADKGKSSDKSFDKAGAAEKTALPQPGKAKLWIVRDGPRVVAVYHAKASKLYLVASDPAKASEKVDLPPGYSDSGSTFDGRLGVRLTTFPPCYGPVQAGDHIFAFTPGKKNLTLALVDTTRWPGRKGAEAVYALMLRCDPALGYVVDCDVDFKADAAKDDAGRPLDPELVNFFPGHVHMQKWPDAAWRYEYTIYTPAGDAKTPAEGRYVGWVNDFGQSDRARGLRLRDGGFVLYAADPQGAGPVLAATVGEGTLLKNDTGNLTFDQHYRATLPEKPDAAGLYGVKARLRYATLPPQAVRLVMERMEVTDWRGSIALPLKVGRVEGAEDEAAILKGSLVYKELPTTDREHHTGAKSLMLVGGRQIRLDPSPPLEPGATYQVEAWVKVTGRGGEARLAAMPAKWVPKGAEAAQQLSASVKPDEGWKQLIMKFTSGPAGSTPWLYLTVSRTGTAYFDDVVISKVEKTE